MNELIEFAMYLTGHDRATVEQMYNDWKDRPVKNEYKGEVCRKCGSSVLEVTGEPDFCLLCRTINW